VNGLKVGLMLMLSSVLVLLCGCSGGGGLASLPGVVQPTIVASASPTPQSTTSPSSTGNPSGSPADEVNPEEGSPGSTDTPEGSPSSTGNPSGSPAEDSGGSGGTLPPSGSTPSAEEEDPSPDPMDGFVPENPGEDPSPDMIPVDELDRLFPNLPPDPGEAGKQTLEGIDADGDGVRDDVQRAIYRLEPRDERKRRAMLQYARGLQRKMLARDNIDQFIQSGDELVRDYFCLEENFEDNNDEDAALKIELLIEFLFYNTKERVLASFEAEASVPSGLYPATGFAGRSDNCDF
jgi:hypothetical protein